MKNLIALALSVCFALALAEGLLHLGPPPRLVGPPVTRADPVYGHVLKPDFRATQATPEFRVRMSINSAGFRGPEPDSTAGAPVLFLGDSFTFGFGVSDGSEYPQLVRVALESRLGHANSAVINAGVGNNGQMRWLKFLRRDAAKWGPRAVVLQMHANDFRDNRNQHLFELGEAGELIEVDGPALEPGRRLQPWIDRLPWVSGSYLFALVRQSFHEYNRRRSLRAAGAEPKVAAAPDPDSAPPGDITIKLIEASLLLCEERGWPVVALLAGLGPDERDMIIPLFERHGVPVALVPTKQARPDLYWPRDGHWNEAGHRFAADRTLELLEQAGLISPASPGSLH